MRSLILLLILFVVLVSEKAFAQSAVIFCVPGTTSSPGSTNPCTPVSTTAPFPVQSN